ncbi:MAG: Nudix family hydrolase [Gammaproteobacteria bacterium]
MSQITQLHKKDIVYVAVAVIRDELGRLLIAKRHAFQDQGGLWEFPGGKLKQGEHVIDALQREIKEETNLELNYFRPLLKVEHAYPEKTVLLDVWLAGGVQSIDATGSEGQELQWVYPADLNQYHFPDANHLIIDAVTLPKLHVITGKFDNATEFSHKLMNALQLGSGLVQLRSKMDCNESYFELSVRARLLCNQHRAKLMLNIPIDEFNYHSADGVHLTSDVLMSLSLQDLIPLYQQGKLVSASTHNQKEIDKANELLLNYIFLSPVNATNSHPDATPLGWDKFTELSKSAQCAVFALGGVNKDDIDKTLAAGGAGIAAINSLWHD